MQNLQNIECKQRNVFLCQKKLALFSHGSRSESGGARREVTRAQMGQMEPP